MGFTSVCETCILNSPDLSVGDLPFVPGVRVSQTNTIDNVHPEQGRTHHDINTSEPRHRWLEQSGLIFPTRHVALSSTGLSSIGW